MTVAVACIRQSLSKVGRKNRLCGEAQVNLAELSATELSTVPGRPPLLPPLTAVPAAPHPAPPFLSSAQAARAVTAALQAALQARPCCCSGLCPRPPGPPLSHS